MSAREDYRERGQSFAWHSMIRFIRKIFYLSGLKIRGNGKAFGDVLINRLKRQGQAGYVVFRINFKGSDNVRQPRNSALVCVRESR